MEEEFDIQLVSVREIPLTEEFLERQNFNWYDLNWWYASETELQVVISGVHRTFSGFLKTVSELQTALDLCGIKHKMIYK